MEKLKALIGGIAIAINNHRIRAVIIFLIIILITFGGSIFALNVLITKRIEPSSQVSPTATIIPSLTSILSPTVSPTNSVTPSLTSTVAPVIKDKNQIVNVMYVGFNPKDSSGDVATTYFSSVMNDQTVTSFEQGIRNKLATSLTKASHNTYTFKVVKTLNIAEFFPYPDGFVFTTQSYSKCVWGTPGFDANYCEQRKIQFDYPAFFTKFNICNIAKDFNVDEIWMLSPPYMPRYESFMVGPGYGFWVNGDFFKVPSCIKNYIVVNGTYDRPLTFLHSFGHRFESTIEYMSSNWDVQERDNHWRRFSRFGAFGSMNQSTSCGNTHFPSNTNTGYNYSNSTFANNNCTDWSNFPNYSGTSQNINCASWGCDDWGWQEYWFNGIPYHDGIAQVKSGSGKMIDTNRNWWVYLVRPQIVMSYVENSSN